MAMLLSAMLPMAVGAGGIHVATGTPVHVLAVVGTVAKYLAIYFPSRSSSKRSPSFAWCRSRNLAGPAFAHAAIDAVRIALLLGTPGRRAARRHQPACQAARPAHHGAGHGAGRS